MPIFEKVQPTPQPVNNIQQIVVMGTCQPASICDRLPTAPSVPSRPRPREIILLPSKLTHLAMEDTAPSAETETLPCPLQPEISKTADKPTDASMEQNVPTEESNDRRSEHTPLRVEQPSQINESLINRWESPSFDPHELFPTINYDALFPQPPK